MTITKTAIGNYLRKQPNGDVGTYRNGFKDGVAWAQKRLTVPQMRKTTRDEKIVNPGVYEVPCTAHPDAPHGFNRGTVATLNRYVCDCEGWVPDNAGGKSLEKLD
jgi:hypothetical protein